MEGNLNRGIREGILGALLYIMAEELFAKTCKMSYNNL